MPETSAAPLITVRDLRVEFPGANASKEVLKRVSLTVQPGEILGLVGESGAGKTTLARSILGVPPTSGRIAAGEVIFEGRNILDLPEPELRKLRGSRLSIVVPNPRAELNPTMTVGKQIAAMARIHLGVDITKPNIDYATLAKSMGVYGQGPIENPNDLGPALKRAVDVVKRGEPALIDVVSQPR